MTTNTRTPQHLVLAAIVSAAAMITAAWWWLSPDRNHFADPANALLRLWLDAGQTASVMFAIGVLGTVLASAGLRFPSARHRLAAPSALLGLGAGGLLGLGAIATTGYLVALAMPLILGFVIVQLIRRGGLARWLAIAAPLAVVGVLIATGVLTAEALPVIAEVFRLVGDQAGIIASEYLLVALLAAWAVTALKGAGRGVRQWVLRHRRTITVLAALGPLPYAVLRLSWLTPWPVLSPTNDIPPQMRLWGLMLSVGAWAGIVLTIGLIRPWGETFPRWLPRVAGREVPVWFAAVPGGLVATVVCAAALPMLARASGSWLTWLEVVFILPFWFWGPMLGLAVWGYVLHRAEPSTVGATAEARRSPAPLR